ncbi:TetR/AcrR family transcriptional regulator [Spirosoma pulveris]
MELLKRNRLQTIQRILEALEEVLAEWGIQETTISRVSEKAGVSKVLIYRYFGGLEGLLQHYIQSEAFLPPLAPLAISPSANKADLARRWYSQTLATYRAFRRSKAAREVLKSTLQANEPLGETSSQAVDEQLTRLVEQLAQVEGADAQALSAVILGGLSYLTVLAQTNRPMLGLDLRGEAEWQRVEGAVKLIYVALNQLAMASPHITYPTPEANPPGQWSVQ